MARLLLIENFSQYPARRLEIQSALQFCRSTRGPHINQRKISIKASITILILTCADVFVGKIGKVVIFNNLNDAQCDMKNYADRDDCVGK